MDELNHSCARFLIHSVGDCFGHHVILAGGSRTCLNLDYPTMLNSTFINPHSVRRWGGGCGAVR